MPLKYPASLSAKDLVIQCLLEWLQSGDLLPPFPCIRWNAALRKSFFPLNVF